MTECASELVKEIAESKPVRGNFCRFCDQEARRYKDLRNQPMILPAQSEIPEIAGLVHLNNCVWVLSRIESNLPAVDAAPIDSIHHFRAVAP